MFLKQLAIFFHTNIKEGSNVNHAGSIILATVSSAGRIIWYKKHTCLCFWEANDKCDCPSECAWLDAEFYVSGKGFAYPSGCKRGGRSESIYAITAFIQAGIGGSLTLLQTKKRCISLFQRIVMAVAIKKDIMKWSGFLKIILNDSWSDKANAEPIIGASSSRAAGWDWFTITDAKTTSSAALV